MKKAFWILVGLLVASVAVNVWLAMRGPKVETTIETKHDTVWKDTVIEKPLPAETINTGRVVYIKVPVPHSDTQGSGTPVSGHSDTSFLTPCVEVPIQIVQKRYDDSLYTAWVSGFEPNLDSILIHQREVTNTVTITNTILKLQPRFSLGIQAGGGYGIINRKPDVYLGIGMQWRLWPK